MTYDWLANVVVVVVVDVVVGGAVVDVVVVVVGAGEPHTPLKIKKPASPPNGSCEAHISSPNPTVTF